MLSPRWTMTDAGLGPSFDDETIGELLAWAGLDAVRHPDEAALVDAVAERLAEGAIVGWFQGRMEYGPRALGSRSILASPIDPEMQARLNEHLGEARPVSRGRASKPRPASASSTPSPSSSKQAPEPAPSAQTWIPWTSCG